MSNMGYCRFQNTVRDLEDCYEHLNENLEELSDSELSARERLVKLCQDIVEEANDNE